MTTVYTETLRFSSKKKKNKRRRTPAARELARPEIAFNSLDSRQIQKEQMKQISFLLKMLSVYGPLSLLCLCFVANAQDWCQPNEIYAECGRCEATCTNPHTACRHGCLPSRCECVAALDYVRDKHGACIKISDCDVPTMMVAFESGGAYQKIFGKLFIQDKEEGSESPGSGAIMASHHPSEVEGVHSYPPENPPPRMEFRGYRTRYQENRRTIHYPPEPRRHDIPPYGNLQRKTVVHSWPPEVHSWPPEAHSYPPEVTGVYSEAMRFSEKKTPGYFPVPIVSDYGNAASHLSGLFYYEGEPERRERSRDYNPYNPLRYEKAKVLSRRKISSLLKQLTPEERMSLRDDGGKASLREVANALTLFDFLEKESNQMVQEKNGTQIGTTRPGPPQTTTAPTGSHSINGMVTRAHGAFETTPPQPSPNLNEKFTMEPEGEPSSAQSAKVSTTTKNVPGSVENDSLTPPTASTETSMQPNSNKVPNSPSTSNKDNHANVTVSSRNTSAAAPQTVISNIFIASQSRVISGNGAPQRATTPPTVASSLVVSNTVTQVAPVTSVSSPSATVATEPSAAANHNSPTQENGASQKSTPSTVAPSPVGSNTATKMPSGNPTSANSTTVAKEPFPATNRNRPTQTNGVSQETTLNTAAPSLVGSNTVTQMAPVTSPSMRSATSEPSSTTNHFHPTQENGATRETTTATPPTLVPSPVGPEGVAQQTTKTSSATLNTTVATAPPIRVAQHHSPQQTGTPQEATPPRSEGWSGTVMKSVSPHSRVVEQAVAVILPPSPFPSTDQQFNPQLQKYAVSSQVHQPVRQQSGQSVSVNTPQGTIFYKKVSLDPSILRH